MKSFKRDISPVCFYFDVVSNDYFKVPIMPIPMRIDKVTNGDPTLFILPDFKKLDELGEKLDLYLDFKSFFTIGINNLIEYTKIKYNEDSIRNLKEVFIRKWFNKSINIVAKIPDLNDAFTFLISEFLILYSNIENNSLKFNSEDYRVELVHYCDNMITYFKRKIEQNSFKVQIKGELQIVKLYREKKTKYHPQITSIDIFNTKTNRSKKMFFVPYLIYDDLLDCFFYDKKILIEEKKTLNYINLRDFNKIIINKSDNVKTSGKSFNLKDLKLNDNL
jgi:hypothetical protein